MPVITTVRGDIDPAELGMTSMHEHLNSDTGLLALIAEQFAVAVPPARMLTLDHENLAFLRGGAQIFSQEAMTAGDVDFTATELAHFRDIGGNAVVDASPIGVRGDVTQLREASARSGVHVVCSTGLYTAGLRPPAFQGSTEQEQYDHFLREVTTGIDGSDVRAGILKCALSATSADARVDDAELTTLRACARVAGETGVSVHVHTAFPMTGEHVLAGVDVVVGDMGLAPDRLVMMHMDSFLRPWDSRAAYLNSIDAVKSIDTGPIERVLDRGVTIGFDCWGTEVEILPQDDDRLKGLIHLVRKGYDGQIVLGHDITGKPQGKSYGGHGFTWFPQLVRRTLAEVGIDEESYRRLTVANPARVLAH